MILNILIPVLTALITFLVCRFFIYKHYYKTIAYKNTLLDEYITFNNKMKDAIRRAEYTHNVTIME